MGGGSGVDDSSCSLVFRSCVGLGSNYGGWGCGGWPRGEDGFWGRNIEDEGRRFCGPARKLEGAEVEPEGSRRCC